MVDKDEFWARLDELGLDKVRENLGLGLYAGRKKTYAEEWVRQREQAIEDQRYEQDIKTPWHKTPSGIVVIGLFVAVVGGLCVAYFAFRLGWVG